MKLEKEVEQSFKEVKKDFKKVASWIDFIEGELKKNEEVSAKVEEICKTLNKWEEKEDFVNTHEFEGLNGHKQPRTNKRKTGVHVQTAVQTAVQTDKIAQLTVNERVILWALLNTETRLSHEDLATLLGKSKSTIRGQVNTIKRKNPEILKEFVESSGKKRLYIPEKYKKSIIKVIKKQKK